MLADMSDKCSHVTTVMNNEQR